MDKPQNRWHRRPWRGPLPKSEGRSPVTLSEFWPERVSCSQELTIRNPEDQIRIQNSKFQAWKDQNGKQRHNNRNLPKPSILNQVQNSKFHTRKVRKGNQRQNISDLPNPTVNIDNRIDKDLRDKDDSRKLQDQYLDNSRLPTAEPLRFIKQRSNVVREIDTRTKKSYYDALMEGKDGHARGQASFVQRGSNQGRRGNGAVRGGGRGGRASYGRPSWPRGQQQLQTDRQPQLQETDQHGLNSWPRGLQQLEAERCIPRQETDRLDRTETNRGASRVVFKRSGKIRNQHNFEMQQGLNGFQRAEHSLVRQEKSAMVVMPAEPAPITQVTSRVYPPWFHPEWTAQSNNKLDCVQSLEGRIDKSKMSSGDPSKMTGGEYERSHHDTRGKAILVDSTGVGNEKALDIKPKRQRSRQCYRCKGYGHLAQDCQLGPRAMARGSMPGKPRSGVALYGVGVDNCGFFIFRWVKRLPYVFLLRIWVWCLFQEGILRQMRFRERTGFGGLFQLGRHFSGGVPFRVGIRTGDEFRLQTERSRCLYFH